MPVEIFNDRFVPQWMLTPLNQLGVRLRRTPRSRPNDTLNWGAAHRSCTLPGLPTSGYCPNDTFKPVVKIRSFCFLPGGGLVTYTSEKEFCQPKRLLILVMVAKSKVPR